MKFMQKYRRYHTLNKKVKFLGKGAKFHAQAQKTSKVDFIWRICDPYRRAGDWGPVFRKSLKQAQKQIFKSKPVE